MISIGRTRAKRSLCEGCHVEGCLLRFVDEFSANRARAARGAAQAPAISSWPRDVGAAAVCVEACRAKGANRASGQARLLGAGFARVGRDGRRLSRKGYIEGQCRTVGMPQTEYGIDEEADRRLMDRAGRQRPAVKRSVGRAVGWIDGCGPKVGSGAIDNLFRPFVQTGCAGRPKALPHLRTSVTNQNDEICFFLAAGNETARQQAVGRQLFGDRRNQLLSGRWRILAISGVFWAHVAGRRRSKRLLH